MIRCSICRLEPDRRIAIDNALRSEQASLQEIAAKSGLTKSSLHRHRQHLIAEPAEMLNLTTSVAHPPPPRPAEQGPAAGSRAAQVEREQLLSRIELLWSESMSGLQAAKKLVRIERPDGSTVDIPGDLRARASFLREARSTLQFEAEVTGELAVAPTFAVQIVMPVTTAEPIEYPVVNIAMPRR